jgi:HSP20 family protein
MMIDRYSPFGRAMSLRQMMDRLMEDAFVMPGEQQQRGNAPTLNAYEEGDNFVVEAQLPGMRPEDLDVNVEHGTLTIRGQSQNEGERQDRNYMLREYRRSSFSRSLRLPETVDVDACDAKFEHGVLRLVFPKSERARPRRISITGGTHPSSNSIGAAGQTSSMGASAGTGDRTGTDQSGSEMNRTQPATGGTGMSGSPESGSESAPSSSAGSGRQG